MRVLHIAAHLGDGAGKAIGGLARMDAASGTQVAILLLDELVKRNHLDRCLASGITVLPRCEAARAMAEADVVVLNWWGGAVMDAFLREAPDTPCRVLLWAHKNGLYDPPLPEALRSACGGLLATSPLTLEKWPEAALVYGFGDFAPEDITPRTDYRLRGSGFTVGYTGSPSFKKLPPDCARYLCAVRERIPGVRFVMAGETTEEFRRMLVAEGLDGCVRLTGWVPDVGSLLETFDAFGYLLRRDTFATTENAVLEAMAAGLPVVMPREPLGKYIVGTEAGLLTSSPEDFASSLCSLWESEALRREKGESGRRRTLTVYDRLQNLRRFQAACRKAAAGPRRPFAPDRRDGT